MCASVTGHRRIGVEGQPLELFPCGLHLCQPAIGGVVEDSFHRQHVERNSGPGDIHDRPGVQVGHPQPAVGLLHQQTLLGKLGQRLTYRRAAHVQCGGKPVLG